MKWLYAGIVLGLLSCPVAWAQRAPSGRASAPRQIDGRLRVNGSLVGTAGVLVILKDSGGAEVTRSMADSAGRFSFLNLQPDNYQIVIQQREFQPVSRTVDLSFSPAASISIDLVPVPSHDAEAAPPGATISAKLPTDDAARQEYQKAQEILSGSKNAKSSISHLQKAAKIEPSFEPTYVLLGEAYMEQKNWKDADTALRKASDLDPKDFSAAFMLGACLNQEEDFAGAEKTLLHSLEINPQAVEGHYELARTYFSLNEWQKAEPHVVQALKLNPDFAPAHVAMGNIFLRRGNAASAQAEYEQYLKLAPDGMFAPGVKTVLAKIKAVSSAQHP